MKVLILGASGFLGSKVFYRMKSESDFNVLGTCFQSNNSDDFIKLDVTIDEKIKSILFEFKPDIILWSLMSRENEKDLIDRGLNNILKYLSPKQKLIFISTNAVFRGNLSKGYYSEDDEPKYKNTSEPLDLYANAKIYGEKLVQQHYNSIIIRPGAIYGQDISGKWDKRISELIKKNEHQEEIVRTKNLYNTFVKVDELATAIIKLIKLDYKGIIHLGPEKKESYYDYYRKIAYKLNLNSSLIKSNVISEALDLSLNTSKCVGLLGKIFSNI
ncbi:GDP-6-deoxy-D-talose 4-dehydrogenase [Clostridium tepidiprofundi DSM 19306]|uniref:dTDP-4-dehydrorhamnose reductase n=1 Tax=Clostridium tepidiprofundi DSM 19306 TaxID=1121338 RepID=A0A151B6G8_9CLOT|nr:sugar nucleotide-binding protein [Clostridium tepidiprofundi]KYH35489.1 GDP-6-deoxy-D-talose 4-dehydrogenase [Clostridium tepidiprofundi DSM 19306]